MQTSSFTHRGIRLPRMLPSPQRRLVFRPASAAGGSNRTAESSRRQRATMPTKDAQNNIMAFFSRDLVSTKQKPASTTVTAADMFRRFTDGVVNPQPEPESTPNLLERLLGPSKDQEEVESTTMSTDIFVLIGLTAAVSFICSLDRSAMSVAILPMSSELHWDAATQGAVSSAFFCGYTLTNIAGGYLATRFDPKQVLAAGVFCWSLFTLATPAAAIYSSSEDAIGGIAALLGVRAFMGIGEGVAYPSIQNLVREAVPQGARSRSLSAIYSGHQVGTIASYLTAPTLISGLGWASVFEIFGAMGFVWLAAWAPLLSKGNTSTTNNNATATSTPAKAFSVAADTPRNATLKPQDLPWGRFLTNSAFWASAAAQITVGIGSCLSFAWLPTFYTEVYGLDVASAASYCVLPALATVATTNAAGWIADGLITNNVLSKTNTRKLLQAIGSLGPAVCLTRLAFVSSTETDASGLTDAVVSVTAWLALGGFSAAGYGSNHQDMSARYAGVLFGVSNGLASVAGSASIYATGMFLHQTHQWGSVFAGAAALYSIGAGIYLTFASAEDQKFDQPATDEHRPRNR